MACLIKKKGGLAVQSKNITLGIFWSRYISEGGDLINSLFD